MKYVRGLLWNLPEVISSIVIVAISIVVSGNVISRYVFFFALPWAEEVSRALAIWLAFVGGTAAVKQMTHFRLGIIRDAMPARLGFALDVVSHLSFMVFGSVLLYYGAQLTMITADQLSPAIQISQGLVYFSIPLSGLMIIVYSAVNLYRFVAAHRLPAPQAPAV